jgi:hypothetical protein
MPKNAEAKLSRGYRTDFFFGVIDRTLMGGSLKTAGSLDPSLPLASGWEVSKKV